MWNQLLRYLSKLAANDILNILLASLRGSDGRASNWWSGGCGFAPTRSATFLHWSWNTFILSLPLIQEGQLSVFGTHECAQYWLTTLRPKSAQLKCGQVNWSRSTWPQWVDWALNLNTGKKNKKTFYSYISEKIRLGISYARQMIHTKCCLIFSEK